MTDTSIDKNLETHLVWIDLEMTGLNPLEDSIIEIATIVTDANLKTVAEGPVFSIHHPEERLQAMDDWNREHHAASGLWNRVVSSTTDMKTAELATLDFLSIYSVRGKSPMCGNSICQDRRFLARLMPELESWFHYRNLDVSTVKELATRWAPSILSGFNKKNRHEALSDIRESIAELDYYRQYMGQFSDGQ